MVRHRHCSGTLASEVGANPVSRRRAGTTRCRLDPSSLADTPVRINARRLLASIHGLSQSGIGDYHRRKHFATGRVPGGEQPAVGASGVHPGARARNRHSLGDTHPSARPNGRARCDTPTGRTATPDAAPASDDAPDHAPTHQPAAFDYSKQIAPATKEPAGEQHASASRQTYSQPQPQNAVFYEQNGLTLEFHWPLDGLSNLSAGETEIFAYNESGDTIEFVVPKITFKENGVPRAQLSGGWGKFPSRSSWDLIEKIFLPPSPYQGETLLLYSGEKVKLHWHIEGITSADTNQEVALELAVTSGGSSRIISQTLLRGSDQSAADVATAPEPTQEPQETHKSAGSDVHSAYSEPASVVRWSFDGTSWRSSGTPPSCADPFVLQTPVDLDLVTSALWPGQQRGAYVAHGGFRFDRLGPDDVTVRAPIGSYLVQAGRYLEGVDAQYLLLFSVPCGFVYRFDHVRTVPANIAEALKHILPPISTDSRTYYLNPPIWMEQGEVVGTSVGIAPSNIFVDFGLYDVRTPNDVVPNPAWADLFAADKEFGHYGVCFFDHLPGADGGVMRSLPTGKEGKTSDFCE